MSSTIRNLIIAGGVLLVLGFAILVGTIGWHNDVVDAEEGVKAQWLDNQNQYDSFWKKVKEVAQVPDKYKEDFKDLLVSETRSKFGKEGSKAQFQWFKDRDINFSDKMYVKVQNVIESGRNDFKRGQTELLDKQRILRATIKKFPGSLMSWMFSVPEEVRGKHAPKEDLDGDGRKTVLDYPIVTSSKTQTVFDSAKEDEPVDVFGK